MGAATLQPSTEALSHLERRMPRIALSVLATQVPWTHLEELVDTYAGATVASGGMLGSDARNQRGFGCERSAQQARLRFDPPVSASRVNQDWDRVSVRSAIGTRPKDGSDSPRPAVKMTKEVSKHRVCKVVAVEVGVRVV